MIMCTPAIVLTTTTVFHVKHIVVMRRLFSHGDGWEAGCRLHEECFIFERMPFASMMGIPRNCFPGEINSRKINMLLRH